MRQSIPKKPTGSDSEATFMQSVWERLFGRSGQFISSDTVKVSETASGISWHAAGGGGGGTSVIQCVVTQLFGTPDVPFDYIGVTQYDLSTSALVGSQFLCEKSFWSQTPDTERIDGQVITYSDYNAILLPENSADNVRLATFSITDNEYQVVSPRYLVYPGGPSADIAQFLLLVTEVVGGTGLTDVNNNPVNYIEMPGRRWAYSPYLNGGND